MPQLLELVRLLNCDVYAFCVIFDVWPVTSESVSAPPPRAKSWRRRWLTAARSSCDNSAVCEWVSAWICITVVHGSILCDPIQPNPSADWLNPTQAEKFGPNPTQPNTTNNDRFPVPVGSVVKSNLTAWFNQILSNRALNALTQSFQIF